MKKLYCVIWSKYKNLGNQKDHIFSKKTLVLPIICTKCKNEEEKIFKEEESIEILKFLGIIENI